MEREKSRRETRSGEKQKLREKVNLLRLLCERERKKGKNRKLREEERKEGGKG